MKKLNCILLVDDDPSSNFIHKSFINRLEICDQVYEAQNGEEALKFLLETKKGNGHPVRPHPDIIMLDLNMPVMDGFTFLQYYSELDDFLKKSKIIILSSSNRKEDIETIEKFGLVSEYMVKPLKKDDWEKLLKTYGSETVL